MNRAYLFPKTFEDAATRPIRQELENVKQLAMRNANPGNAMAMSADKYYNDPSRSGNGMQTYTGAKFKGALGAGFPTSWGVDREVVLERSRRAYIESPAARKLIHRIADFTIGNGLSYQAAPTWELIDGQGDPSDNKKKTRARVKRDLDLRFHMWANSHEPDVRDQKTLYELQHDELIDLLKDGETFTVLRYQDDPMRMNPVSVQRYRPEQVCSPTGALEVEAAKAAGNTICEGIELDSEGREVAVWIRVDETKYLSTPVRIPVKSAETGRRFVIHRMLPGPPGQVRGVSVLAPYLHELQKIDDARLAELEAMVLNSMLAWYVKPGPDAPGSDMLAKIKGRATADANGGVRQDGAVVQTMRPGIIPPPLKGGEDLKSFDTARPNLDVTAFSKEIEGAIHASEGMAPEMADIKYDTAYTAARGAILTTWTTIDIYRDAAASQWLGYILESWFVAEIAAGRIKAKGFGDSPLIRRAWLNCTWLGTNMPSVNPLQEVQAIKIRTELGHTTGRRESMKYNNSDMGENLKDLKDENNELAEARRELVAVEKGAQLTLGMDEQPAEDPRSDPASPDYDPNFKPAGLRNVTPLRGSR